ncbi:MAG: alpha/beta hydrolase [Proteobacteria bacterium]|nr:alpha/beta hydrolase [Pseudomonadota bacterium]
MTIVHETVAANGLRLHVARAGHGPLMLFLHGFPEYWAMWQPLLEHFGARGWCAAAPDLRGYNLSDKPAAVEAYRAKHLVADVLALAAHYTKDKFVLVAHDWGGAVAWGVAIAHPERLSRLVMLNSPHPYVFWRELCNNPAQQQASEYMLLFRLAKAERVLTENGYARLLGAFSDLDEAARKALIEAWSQPGALTGGLNYYRASPMYPPSPEDPGAKKLQLKPEDFTVKVSTLVVWGERDAALLPGCLDGLDEVVPDLKLVRVPEASHWIARERTDLVIREIEAFTIHR